MTGANSISKHFKVVSLTDPTVSTSMASDFDLSTLSVGTVIKHDVGTRYVKSAPKVFDRLENGTLSRYDLPYELALSDKRMYLILTAKSFTARNAYSASQISSKEVVSGETPTTGSYYCIGCVELVDTSKAYTFTETWAGGCGTGCGCGSYQGGSITEAGDVTMTTRYLSLFIRYV